MASRLFGCALSVALIATFAGRAIAVHPSELLLPATTKGFISTQDVDEVRTKFNATQLGEMAADPIMKPFIDDFKKQILAKLEKAGKKLGIRWDDMEGVYGGEAAAALIQPDPKDKMSHATALIVDITGKKKEIYLNGHSGGGSFIFGYLAGVEKIPSQVKRISFLDSDYGYDSSYSAPLGRRSSPFDQSSRCQSAAEGSGQEPRKPTKKHGRSQLHQP